MRTKASPYKAPKARTAPIREDALAAAQHARILTKQTLTDFISGAVAKAALPIIRENAGKMAAIGTA